MINIFLLQQLYGNILVGILSAGWKDTVALVSSHLFLLLEKRGEWEISGLDRSLRSPGNLFGNLTTAAKAAAAAEQSQMWNMSVDRSCNRPTGNREVVRIYRYEVKVSQVPNYYTIGKLRNKMIRKSKWKLIWQFSLQIDGFQREREKKWNDFCWQFCSTPN